MSWSSALKGAARRSVSSRTARKASARSLEREPESEKSEGEEGRSAAAAVAFFVTGVSVSGRERCACELVPNKPVLDRASNRGKKPSEVMILLTSGYRHRPDLCMSAPRHFTMAVQRFALHIGL